MRVSLWLALTLMASASVHAALEQRWSNPTPTGAELVALAHDPDTGRTVAVGRVGAVVTSDDAGLSWTDRTDLQVIGEDLLDVVVVGPNAWVAVGSGGGVHRSFDGGVTWQSAVVPGAGTLRDVERVGSALIAVGDAGVIARSEDDGESWAVSTPLADDLRGQGWRDDTYGVVVSSFAVHETDDGGATWSEIAETTGSGFFTDATWFDAMHGFILLDFGYFETTDGGSTWTDHPALGGDVPLYLGTLVELDPDHWVLASDGEGAEMWTTVDGGGTWTRTDDRYWARGYVDLILHPDGVLLSASELGDLVRSVDDGAGWTNTTESPADDIRVTLGAMAVRPDGVLFAGGRSSQSHVQVMRSDDDGLSWEEVSHPGAWFNAFTFVSDAVGFAGGDPDVIHRTADGGTTWTTIPLSHPLGSGYRVSDLSAPDASTVVVSGFGASRGGVFRSVDGGLSWSFASGGLPANQGLNTVSFVDAMTGYAGTGGAGGSSLYRTTDGGASWQPMSTVGFPLAIRDMHWYDADEGLIAGWLSPGGIIRTENGGDDWEPVTDVAVRFLVPLGGGSLLAIPSQGSAVLVSDDRGRTWTPIPTVLPDAPQCGVSLGAGDFLVGGNATRVVRIDRDDVVAVADAEDPDPSPLRALRAVGTTPTLVVSGVEGPVRVVVHDVLGRRVATLTGVARVGSPTELRWTGTNHHGRPMAPGLYLARLEGWSGSAVRLVLTP